MPTEEIIAGLIVLIVGGFQGLFPGLMLRFQVWTQRVIMGAEYKPTNRTRMIVRVIGILVALLGVLILTGVLQ